MPSPWQVSRAAITASGEQQARSESGASGSIQSRSVTPIAAGPARSSATALSTPPLIATATRSGSGSAPEDRPDRVRERVDGERLAADGGRFEQRQADERAVEAVGVGLDDSVAVEREPNESPVAPRECVSGHLDHRSRLAERARRRH